MSAVREIPARPITPPYRFRTEIYAPNTATALSYLRRKLTDVQRQSSIELHSPLTKKRVRMLDLTSSYNGDRAQLGQSISERLITLEKVRNSLYRFKPGSVILTSEAGTSRAEAGASGDEAGASRNERENGGHGTQICSNLRRWGHLSSLRLPWPDCHVSLGEVGLLATNSSGLSSCLCISTSRKTRHR